MSEQVINSVTQGMLAKLLATENITVHVGSYKTAMFDVKNRLLCLPAWNTDSKQVSDLLVGHEVGHALYTPVESIDTFKAMCPKCPFAILNIVEDVRIERLIQDRYPGLISAFNAGYARFLQDDRFRLRGRDPNSLGFADRLNLKAKCSDKVDIKFTSEESVIFQRCLTAETIEDVYAICIDVYEMIKKDKKQKEILTDKEDPDAGSSEDYGDTEVRSIPSEEDVSDDDEEEIYDSIENDPNTLPPSTDTNTESDGDNHQELSDDAENSESSDDDLKKDRTTAKAGAEGDDDGLTSDIPERDYGDVEDELESSTLDSLNESLEDLYTDFGRSLPVIAPTREQVLKQVVPVSRVMNSRMVRSTYKATFLEDTSIFKDWIRFKKETMKNIQFLITEFERKKAAFQYTRSKTSDSGDIDVNKLHSYRFDDHIFRTVTQLADAKSHGMMFFIDYSSSMVMAIHDVINHTLNLIMFCKAVNIPFQVFGFTTPVASDFRNDEYRKEVPMNALSLSSTNIFELVNSSMKTKDYELALRHLRAQAYKKSFLRHTTALFMSEWEYMNGTPLNEVLVAAHTLVPEFRKKHHVQKMNVMILSDGASQAMKYGLDLSMESNIRKPKTGTVQSRFAMNLNGREISLAKDEQHNYAILIENLKITCNCTTVGFFINDSNIQISASAIAAIRYSRELGWTDKSPGLMMKASTRVTEDMKRLRKDRVIFIANGYNYDGYFLMNSRYTAIVKDTDFSSDVPLSEFEKDEISASTQNKLATEFKRFTSNKKSSRIILGKFAELIS